MKNKLILEINRIKEVMGLLTEQEQVSTKTDDWMSYADGKPYELFGFKASVINEGIRSVQGAGRALKDIAGGLMAFQELINQNIKFGTPDGNGNFEEGTMGYAISNTVNFIRSAFASVGTEGTQNATGLWGALGFKQNVVQAGIYFLILIESFDKIF
jgi:hypothetical protein